MANRNIQPGAGLEMENKNAGRVANAVTLVGTQTWIVPIQMLDNLDIEVTTTGTATAAITILISSSYRFSTGVNTAATVIQAGTFTDITANGIAHYPFCERYGTDPAGAPAFNRFCLFQVPSGFVEIKSILASGAGTITIYLNGKGF